MKLNVNFNELAISAAKMRGLDGLLSELRKQKVTFQFGLSEAKKFVEHNDGKIIKLQDNSIKLVVGDEEAICFQLYKDIDLFYYEN